MYFTRLKYAAHIHVLSLVLTSCSIAKYPNVSFTIVVNPFNGPGIDKLPDTNYQQEVPKLTRHSNVRVVGYVHTSWAKRDLGLVCADVSRYAAWPEHSGNPGLRVDGIFVDETPNIYDSDAEVYLSKLRDHVKAMPGGENNPVGTASVIQMQHADLGLDHPQPRLCA